MLFNARLSKEYWAGIVVYASHLINRLPSMTIDGKISLKVCGGNLPLIMILYIFFVLLNIIM